MSDLPKKTERRGSYIITYKIDGLQWILNKHSVFRHRPKKFAALKKDLEGYISNSKRGEE